MESNPQPYTFTWDRFARFMVQVALPIATFVWLVLDVYDEGTIIEALKGAAIFVLAQYAVLALMDWKNKKKKEEVSQKAE